MILFKKKIIAASFVFALLCRVCDWSFAIAWPPELVNKDGEGLFVEEDEDNEKLFVDILWLSVKSQPIERRPKVALVLGGGGARGISQIGVGFVIKQEEIPIDLVVGTSIGAAVGAFYCAGIPFERLYKLAKNFKLTDISNLNCLSYLNMLLVGNTISNKKLEKFITKNIGDILFDQLKTPLICVATDLNTGERILLREGSVARAVQASTAIPGMFKPVEYRQRYLIDGGISENIPVSVAKIFNADVIVAVAVSADITKNVVNNVSSILAQAICIQGESTSKYNLSIADVIIKPNIGVLSIVDFKNAYETIDIGFVAAKSRIKDIKKVIIDKMPGKYLLE